MCQSAREGGARCEYHNGTVYATSKVGSPEWVEAATEYATTDDGRMAVIADMERFAADSQDHLVNDLSYALWRADDIRDIAAERQQRVRDSIAEREITRIYNRCGDEAKDEVWPLLGHDDPSPAIIDTVLEHSPDSAQVALMLARAPRLTPAQQDLLRERHSDTPEVMSLLAARHDLTPATLTDFAADPATASVAFANPTMTADVATEALMRHLHNDGGITPTDFKTILSSPHFTDRDVAMFASMAHADFTAGAIMTGRLLREEALMIHDNIPNDTPEKLRVGAAIAAAYPDSVRPEARKNWVAAASADATVASILPLSEDEQHTVMRTQPSLASALLTNPAVAPSVVSQAARNGVVEAVQHPSLPVEDQIALARTAEGHQRLMLASSPHLSAAAIKEFLNPDTGTTGAIVLQVMETHPDKVSTKTLNQWIANADDKSVSYLTLNSRALPPSTQTAIAASGRESQKGLLRRGRVTPAVVSTMVKSTEPVVRGDAARSHHLTSRQVTQLANDPSAGVRGRLAQNRTAPVETLKKLSYDKNYDVQFFADLTLLRLRGNRPQASTVGQSPAA